MRAFKGRHPILAVFAVLVVVGAAVVWLKSPRVSRPISPGADRKPASQGSLAEETSSPSGVGPSASSPGLPITQPGQVGLPGQGVPSAAAVPNDPNAVLEQLTQALLGSGSRWTDADTARVKALEAKLLALGEQATGPVIARLQRGTEPPEVRNFLFHVVRQLPGAQAFEYVMAEAKSGTDETLRTMAIEALGQKGGDASLSALSDIARFDPELPIQPKFDKPRDPQTTSTELPHDAEMTPRLRAMAALAEMDDPRATNLLVDLSKTAPDPALRMHACRHLEAHADTPMVQSSLITAARSDPTAYVRLAAIGSLSRSRSNLVRRTLRDIVKADRDSGVRILAAQVLEQTD